MASRIAKEAFVSGHHGTSITEINAIVLSVPLLVFAFSRDRPDRDASGSHQTRQRGECMACLLEYLWLVVPQVLVVMGVGSPALLAALSAAAAACVALTRLLQQSRRQPQAAADTLASRAADRFGEARWT